MGGGAGGTVGVVAGGGALATLIGFINLSGLLIVRSIDRRRELAVRSALGAGRADIAKQLLLEATALVMMGTAGGVLLAFWMTPALGTLVLAPFGGVAHRSLQVSWAVIGLVSPRAIA